MKLDAEAIPMALPMPPLAALHGDLLAALANFGLGLATAQLFPEYAPPDFDVEDWRKAQVLAEVLSEQLLALADLTHREAAPHA